RSAGAMSSAEGDRGCGGDVTMFQSDFANQVRGESQSEGGDPPSKKKTAWQQSYNPKTGNTDIGKFALLKFGESLEKGQQLVNKNKSEIIGFSKEMQKIGENTTTTGLAATAVAAGAPFEGIGAIPGLKVAEIGGFITLEGKAIKVVTNALTGDEKAAAHDTAVEITSQAAGALVGSFFPIPNTVLANSTKEFLKASKEIVKNTSSETVKKNCAIIR
ncbi:hypothetical protein LPB87_15910, partial [Flavobacterium sp. EDS]|uniref:hypothetical protein n=1 Tax=Flavobacterium sp. EDS TaxID=2897328 RepID=UPI001E3E2E35